MEFKSFQSIARLAKPATYSEKIDGTNGVIGISPKLELFAGSREKWLSKAEDNYGFWQWVQQNKEELIEVLGPGRHYGEWWGEGIAREYGLKERRFSLFNVSRWAQSDREFKSPPPWAASNWKRAPTCCHVVPVLRHCQFSTLQADNLLIDLVRDGSTAAPGFMNPEGIIVAHMDTTKGLVTLFKKTLNGDKK